MTDGVLSTFTVAGLLLGMKVEHVQEVLRNQTVTPVPLAAHGVVGLINLRGQLATVVDARARLGLPPAEDGRSAVDFIIRTASGTVDLLVDEEGEVVDLGSEPADDVPETVAATLRGFLTGIHQLEGRLLLVVDVDRLLLPGAG